MPDRFPMKEIAFQAGLSLATVDRVLNGRAGVRADRSGSPMTGPGAQSFGRGWKASVSPPVLA